MSMRIATYPHVNGMSQNNMSLQSSYARKNEQISSGLQSATYGGLADDTQVILRLESDIKAAENYSRNLSQTEAELNTMYDATGNIVEQLDDVISALGASLGGGLMTDNELLAEAKAAYEEIAALMNVQYNDRYLFGGANTSKPPVDIDDPDYGSPFAIGGPADTGYYQGDATVQQVRAAEGYNISYGVTADNSAFEQALRGLDMLISSPGDDDVRDASYDLLQASSDEFAVIQHQISVDATTVQDRKDEHDTTQTQLQNTLATIKETDIATASTELSSIETQLEASYSATAKLLDLTILDYLR